MSTKNTIPYLSEEILAGLNISTIDVIESIEEIVISSEKELFGVLLRL